METFNILTPPSRRCGFLAGVRDNVHRVYRDLSLEVMTQKLLFSEHQYRPMSLAQALACHFNSYSEVKNYLEKSGATPTQITTLFDECMPHVESHFFKFMKPWTIHFSKGGKCQHKTGH